MCQYRYLRSTISAAVKED